MEYQIVEGQTAEAVERGVKAAISEGWRPIGGVAIAALRSTLKNERKGYVDVDDEWVYAQAMMRDGAGA